MCVRRKSVVNIYICLLFVGNNEVLLGIKFMFKNKNERIEVLNKKEVKFFFDIIIMSVS